MASDVYPSEQTRSPRFGSKHQLISLDATLFILLVSDYVIKSIISVLQPNVWPLSLRLCFHPSIVLKLILSLYLGHPCPLFNIFCGFVRSDSDKIRCADINLSFDIFFCRGRGHTDKSNKWYFCNNLSLNIYI